MERDRGKQGETEKDTQKEGQTKRGVGDNCN